MGENSDRVGLVRLSIYPDRSQTRSILHKSRRKEDGDKTTIAEGSRLKADDGARVRVSSVKHKLGNQRIKKLLVNSFPGDSSIGYLMACTIYGVQWYNVRLDANGNPLLDFIACKIFKSCGVVDACWSPHLPEESLLLLESGELFLFDLDDCLNTEVLRLNFRGKRLKVSWKDWDMVGRGGWLGCEFSWHPRILVVAHSSTVFLLDFRARECDVACLLEINTSAMCTPAGNDRFAAVSKVDSDGFHFVVASEHRVILFDVRKPMMPLLQWTHDIPSPSYITVLPLSDLRSSPKDDDRFEWASKFGKCIVMGSFWDCQFNVFCYGPNATKTVASEITNYGYTLYAWDIPSELSLSGCECTCGSCLLREEFWKDSLPAWIDWRQKKEIVLGFGILDKDLDAELSEGDGFTVIRLMSSGKIESQRYIPTQNFENLAKEPFKELKFDFQDSLLYNNGELEYKFQKRFQYLKLDYLYSYMKDDLDKVLYEKVKEPRKVLCKSDYISTADFHQSVCEKLKACGLLRSSHAVSNVLTHIRLMSSIHEVTLSKIWTRFPADLLQLAFSYYSQLLEVLLDQKKVSLEFLDIPNQPQFPPYIFREPSHRSSRWSQKVQPSTAFVGPVLPTPVLLTSYELRKEEAFEFSADSEIRHQCSEVIEAANEIATSGSACDFHDKNAVSLGDDRDQIFEDTQSMNVILSHKSVPKTYESPTEDAMPEDSFCYDERFTTFICKKTDKDHSKNGAKMDGPVMFDSLSPVELKFDGKMEFGNGQDPFIVLKRHYSKFLQSYDPYQQYLKNCKLHK